MALRAKDRFQITHEGILLRAGQAERSDA